MPNECPTSFEKAYQAVKQRLSDSSFINQHRQKTTDFTRSSKLTFQHLMLFLLNQVKGSLQQELDGFYQGYNGSDTPFRVIEKSTFCEARKKLKISAFRAINQLLVDEVNKGLPLKQWHGYQLYAVDGCRMRLPNEAIIGERFGHLGSGTPDHDCPMGLASACYDVMNDLVVDAKMAASFSSEREMAMDHFKITLST